MIIACSAGHIYDLDTFSGRWKSNGKQLGDRCPMETSYDRMAGNTYCGRVLREVDDNGCITLRNKKIKI